MRTTLAWVARKPKDSSLLILFLLSRCKCNATLRCCKTKIIRMNPASTTETSATDWSAWKIYCHWQMMLRRVKIGPVISPAAETTKLQERVDEHTLWRKRDYWRAKCVQTTSYDSLGQDRFGTRLMREYCGTELCIVMHCRAF